MKIKWVTSLYVEKKALYFLLFLMSKLFLY